MQLAPRTFISFGKRKLAPQRLKTNPRLEWGSGSAALPLVIAGTIVPAFAMEQLLNRPAGWRPEKVPSGEHHGHTAAVNNHVEALLEKGVVHRERVGIRCRYCPLHEEACRAKPSAIAP